MQYWMSHNLSSLHPYKEKNDHQIQKLDFVTIFLYLFLFLAIAKWYKIIEGGDI